MTDTIQRILKIMADEQMRTESQINAIYAAATPDQLREFEEMEAECKAYRFADWRTRLRLIAINASINSRDAGGLAISMAGASPEVRARFTLDGKPLPEPPA